MLRHTHESDLYCKECIRMLLDLEIHVLDNKQQPKREMLFSQRFEPLQTKITPK